MDKAAVLAREGTWSDAFSRGDAAGVAAHYALDAHLLPPNMPAISGRDGIEAMVKEFTTGPVTASARLDRFYDGGDVGVAVGHYELTMTADGDEVTDTGKFIEVWREVDGELVIVEDIFNSDLEAPPAG